MTMEATPVASSLQRSFYRFFHRIFLSSLQQALEIFPQSPELDPSMKGQLVVRAFVHATCAGADGNGNIVPTVTREAFLEVMASQYDQTMTDMMVTNAANPNSTGG